MNKIEKGDVVRVCFNNIGYTLSNRAKVLHIPIAMGDSWVFEDEYGNVHHVSEGMTVTRIK